MLGESRLVSLGTGTSTAIPSAAGMQGLLSYAISGGTASAAATFTATLPEVSGTTTATFVIASPANGFSARRFVSGVQIIQMTASVASNGACDVEVL